MSNDTPDFSTRDSAAGVAGLFTQRFSPRSYLQEPISDSQLTTIFDASRWSPSCFNIQPWHFFTSTETTHDKFLALLIEKNQAWAKSAPVLGFVVASKIFNHNGVDHENKHAVFDSGAAWMAINLQASMLGLYAHGMAGIHHDEVYRELDINPETHQVICGFALGRPDTSDKPDISPRKPLADIWQKCH